MNVGSMVEIRDNKKRSIRNKKNLEDVVNSQGKMGCCASGST